MPDCAIYAAHHDRETVVYRYLTVGDTPLALPLCQRHRYAFIGSSFDPPMEARIGVTDDPYEQDALCGDER